MAAVEQLIRLDQAEDWRAALEGVPHAFAHTWESCYAMQLTSGLATFLYSFEQDGVRVVCPLCERNFEGMTDIVTPNGFSGFTSNGTIPRFSDRWRTFACKRGYVCGYIALNPFFENPAHYGQTHDINVLFHLDLSLGATELLARSDRDRRRLVRNWDRSGNIFITDRGALTEFLIANHHDVMRRVGAGASAFFTDDTLRSICSAPQVEMVGAGSDGVIEAVYIFAHTPWAGDCMFNVATPAGRQFTTALLWWGVERLAGLGVPYLNLGAGVRPDDNIAAAKEKFRPQRRAFRCLKEVYRPDEYERQCRLAGADPNDRNGYFPPFRSPGALGAGISSPS